MKFEQVEQAGVRVYGDRAFRGKCAVESVEQVTFFNWLRREYPDSFGALAVHPRNEGQLRGGQFYAMQKVKAEGMTPGASDIIIPGAPAFVCEMKRRDHTRSTWQDGQIDYLTAAAQTGCFVCVALGYEAAKEAVHEWMARHVA